jgi:hypothetical protein
MWHLWWPDSRWSRICPSTSVSSVNFYFNKCSTSLSYHMGLVQWDITAFVPKGSVSQLPKKNWHRLISLSELETSSQLVLFRCFNGCMKTQIVHIHDNRRSATHIFAIWKLKISTFLAAVRQCYKCGKFGHISKSCTKEQHCCSCGEAKHERSSFKNA